MTGEIIWMTILMWIAASAAFAPLGYFIYKYSLNTHEGPFGKANADGKKEHSAAEVAGLATHALKKGLIGGK